VPHILSGKIVRLDSGGPTKRIPKLKATLPACEALLVSDYGYGAIEGSGAAGCAQGIPSTIDSRFSMEFTGMTAATPNEPEVEAALGIHIGR
jgi:bifunctional ADP-heptose synthase (sugar kinase/adenylyltransferase)